MEHSTGEQADPHRVSSPQPCSASPRLQPAAPRVQSLHSSEKSACRSGNLTAEGCTHDSFTERRSRPQGLFPALSSQVLPGQSCSVAQPAPAARLHQVLTKGLPFDCLILLEFISSKEELGRKTTALPCTVEGSHRLVYFSVIFFGVFSLWHSMLWSLSAC